MKGPNFIGLHELFDKIAATVETYADKVAERVVQLGGIAEGTARVAAARSRLDEYPLSVSEGLEHVNAVLMALANFGHDARLTIEEADAFDDADTAGLFTEISRGLDHWPWFVEAHAQSPKGSRRDRIIHDRMLQAANSRWQRMKSEDISNQGGAQ